jgi:hypothetical protein
VGGDIVLGTKGWVDMSQQKSELLKELEERAEKKLIELGKSISAHEFEEERLPTFSKTDGRPVYYSCSCGEEHRLWPQDICIESEHEWKNGRFLKSKKNGRLLKSEFTKLAANEIYVGGKAITPKDSNKKVKIARLLEYHLRYNCFHYGFWEKKSLFSNTCLHLVRCPTNKFSLLQSDGKVLLHFTEKVMREIWIRYGGIGFIPGPKQLDKSDFVGSCFPIGDNMDWFGGYFPRGKDGALLLGYYDYYEDPSVFDDDGPTKFGEYWSIQI